MKPTLEQLEQAVEQAFKGTGIDERFNGFNKGQKALALTISQYFPIFSDMGLSGDEILAVVELSRDTLLASKSATKALNHEQQLAA